MRPMTTGRSRCKTWAGYFMRQLLLFVLLLTGCEQTIHQEYPVANVPLALRQENYAGGSCVWASTVTLLNWQGQPLLARQVRGITGGALPGSHTSELDRLGVRYAYVTNGDEKFLEWAIRTRRGAGIVWNDGRHMINLVELNQSTAVILDNNSVTSLTEMPREKMLREWRAAGGWAFSVVYSPTAPLPQ